MVAPGTHGGLEIKMEAGAAEDGKSHAETDAIIKLDVKQLSGGEAASTVPLIYGIDTNADGVDDKFYSDENKFAVPLDVRIKKDGEYIIGSENEWAVSAAFDSDIYIIEPESDNVYELEWKWDFYNNDDDDIRDTRLGVNAHYENEPYNVNIKVLAETEPESSVPETSDNSKPDPPEDSVPEPSIPQDDKYVPPITGDNGNTEIIVTLGFIASSLFIMVISSIISFRERNKVKV